MAVQTLLFPILAQDRSDTMFWLNLTVRSCGGFASFFKAPENQPKHWHS